MIKNYPALTGKGRSVPWEQLSTVPAEPCQTFSAIPEGSTETGQVPGSLFHARALTAPCGDREQARTISWRLYVSEEAGGVLGGPLFLTGLGLIDPVEHELGHMQNHHQPQ